MVEPMSEPRPDLLTSHDGVYTFFDREMPPPSKDLSRTVTQEQREQILPTPASQCFKASEASPAPRALWHRLSARRSHSPAESVCRGRAGKTPGQRTLLSLL